MDCCLITAILACLKSIADSGPRSQLNIQFPITLDLAWPSKAWNKQNCLLHANSVQICI